MQHQLGTGWFQHAYRYPLGFVGENFLPILVPLMLIAPVGEQIPQDH